MDSSRQQSAVLASRRIFTLCSLAGIGLGQPDIDFPHTVLVMRHCVRSTPDIGIHAVPGLGKYNDYVPEASPWPSFNVPEDYDCVPRGKKLVTEHGRWFKKNSPLPPPLHMVVDNNTRDKDTAEAFIKGLGMDVASNRLNPNAFSVHKTERCNWTAYDEDRELKTSYKTKPLPEMQNYVNELLSIVDKEKASRAGDWTNIACQVNKSIGPNKWPMLVGNCQAGKKIVERLFMQWGSGEQSSLGYEHAEKLPRLMRLHNWYRYVTSVVPEKVRHQQANFARAVLEDLQRMQGGTTVYVGHDSQMEALEAILGLNWAPNPFPANMSLPGSALLFSQQGGDVKAKYIYLADFSQDGSNLTNVTAFFGTQESTKINLLRRLVMDGTEDACVDVQEPWLAPLFAIIFFVNALIFLGLCLAKSRLSEAKADDSSAVSAGSLQLIDR